MFNNLLQSQHGQYYKLQTPNDISPGLTLEPRNFSNPDLTCTFLRQLRTPHRYWHRLLQRMYPGNIRHLNQQQVHRLVSQLLIDGKIRLYPVKPANHLENPPEKVTIKVKGEASYRFAEISTLLLTSPKEVKRFSSPDEAESFIQKLNPEQEQLKHIANQLDIPLDQKTAGSSDSLTSAIATSLAGGKGIVIVDRTSSSPPPEETPQEDKSTVGNRKADLGSGSVAAVAAVSTENKEDLPPCTTDSVSVTCGHGRMAEITDKTEATPVLAVVATESNKAGLEQITAEIHGSALCPSHKSAAFQISREHKIKSKGEKKIVFQASCAEWNMDNVFERIWLPSVAPKSYQVTPKETCKTKDLKVSELQVDVYPEMKWNWDVNINFGKLDFVPGKNKVVYSDFAIDGNVKLTYDRKPYDAREKYDEYIRKPLEGFKNICDKISKVLEIINDPKAALMRIGTNAANPPPPEGEDNKDGNESRLAITWPNLSIQYESQLLENQDPAIIDHDFSIGLSADPLINVDIQVDVLDSLIAAAPYAVSELIKFAQKRIEKEIDKDSKVGFSGELDIIFTAGVKVKIDKGKTIEGKHNAKDSKYEVAPITGDIAIPASLEGKVRAEGKWFIISFKVNYELKGKAGWEGKYEFGKDETGIYFANTLEFTGIDVTATKYEEVKTEVDADAETKDDFLSNMDISAEAETDNASASVKLEDGKLEGKATLKAKESKTWQWLEPEVSEQKSNATRHYFIKN